MSIKTTLLLRAYAIAVLLHCLSNYDGKKSGDVKKEQEGKESSNWLESNFVFFANIFHALHLTLHTTESFHRRVRWIRIALILSYSEMEDEIFRQITNNPKMLRMNCCKCYRSCLLKKVSGNDILKSRWCFKPKSMRRRWRKVWRQKRISFLIHVDLHTINIIQHVWIRSESEKGHKHVYMVGSDEHS